MKKLTIVINGLEYVEKNSEAYYLNQLSLLDDIIKEKNNEISDLQRNLESQEDSNVKLQDVINEKLKLIKSLNEHVDELEEEVCQMFNENTDLRDTLETIQSAIERAL